MSLKLGLFAILLFVGYEPTTEAHDIYSPLKDRWGNSCCNDQDCRPVPYRVTPAGVQMLVYGNWIAVLDHVIQYRALPGDTGETAGGHWCGEFRLMQDETVSYSTLCAILPPNGAAILGLPSALRESRVQPVP
ncbi:MAG: hypothetical protein ABW003_07780 [Microvirga sp.]